MALEKVVLDASVIAKWYLNERYSKQALKLRDDYVSGRITIAVPTLFEYEVLNALKTLEYTQKKNLQILLVH